MNTRQIADHGVALVKTKLSRLGFQAQIASDNTTEIWVDTLESGRRFVVKVATNEKPKPSGGRGALALDWWIRDNLQADAVAFVDLSSQRVWLVEISALPRLAQQHSSGRFHLYMYIDRNTEGRTGRATHISDFASYLIETHSTTVIPTIPHRTITA